jgi:predicted HicB family RNase H-like nuclease
MEIQYKGFVARILYSADVDVFYGEIFNSGTLEIQNTKDEGTPNIRPLLVFQASSLQGCKEAMYYAVEDYLASLLDVLSHL